jgi:hypothetical protein
VARKPIDLGQYESWLRERSTEIAQL